MEDSITKRRLKIITTLVNTSQWPEYLENEAEYYHRGKLKRDLLGAAEIIRQLLERIDESSCYTNAVTKLRKMADEREAMFDGKRTFKMIDAIELTNELEEIRRVADLLEKEMV